MTSNRSSMLRARFEKAMQRIGVVAEVAALFDELATRYAEPQRYYHTLSHVDDCLAWLDWFCASAEHPAEVELALWFHDAIYDLGAADNEHRSAELARARLQELGADRDTVARIAKYIESTASHIALRGDAALVIDLDLTILGAAPGAFRRFEEAIRREYSGVPDQIFNTAR